MKSVEDFPEFLRWRELYEGIDAVFWWIIALRKTSSRLSGYGSITFRRFLERNAGLNWQMALQLRLVNDYGMKC
jgi:hypothetical protein